MSEAGVSMVRMDFLWNDIEPAQGQFIFEKYDKIVNSLTDKHIEVLGLLSYNAAWTGREWNEPPDIDLFMNYAVNTVRHFKGRVHYWEIWNEPDEKLYWNKQDDMRLYSELLKRVSLAIKKEDPSAKIVLGGVSRSIPVSLRKVYKNAGKEYFDVVSFHPFVDPKLSNALEGLQGIYKGVYRIMEQYGDADKPIWFTEIGCPGVRTPNKQNGWWHGISPTEQEQAEWLRKVYQSALQWKNVDKIFWAFFRDTPDHFHGGVDNFGLLRSDFSKKPSFESYKKLTTDYRPKTSMESFNG